MGNYYCSNCDQWFTGKRSHGQNPTCPICDNEMVYDDTDTVKDIIEDMFGEDGPDDGFTLDDFFDED